MDEWAWMERGSEEAHGPFSSKAGAIDAAIEHFGDDASEVFVGRITRFDPAAYLDLDDLLERVNENACEEDFCWADDAVGDVLSSSAKEATAELHAWARKWILGDNWFLRNDCERTKLSRRDDGEHD